MEYITSIVYCSFEDDFCTIFNPNVQQMLHKKQNNMCGMHGMRWHLFVNNYNHLMQWLQDGIKRQAVSYMYRHLSEAEQKATDFS